MKKIIIFLSLLTLFSWHETLALSKNTWYFGDNKTFLLEDNLALLANNGDNYEGYVGTYELKDDQIILKPTILLTNENWAYLINENEITPIILTYVDETITYKEDETEIKMTRDENHDSTKSISDILNTFKMGNTLAGTYKNSTTEIQIHEDRTMEVWTNTNNKITGLFGTYHSKNNDLIFTSKYVCQNGKCTKQTLKMKFSRKINTLENEESTRTLKATDVWGTFKKMYLAQYGKIEIKIFDENNYLKITLVSLALVLAITTLVWLIKDELKKKK